MMQGEGRRSVNAKTVLGVFLVIIALLFITQNSEDTRIDFLWMHFTMSLWLTLLIVFLLGMLSALALRGARNDSNKKKSS